MGDVANVYLFGDQTYDIGSSLSDLLVSEGDPILKEFFTRAYNTLRACVGGLSQTHRQQFRRFSSIADLLALKRQGQLHPSLGPALTCIYQLGSFMRMSGRNRGSYPQPYDCFLAGLGIGVLTAAAISSCKTLSDLLLTAVHTVEVAFRMGLRAADIGSHIEPMLGSNPAPWSIIYRGLSLKKSSESISAILKNQHLPVTSKPYVSAALDYGTAISGPPSILNILRESDDFASLTGVELPVWAPYHAPHLFNKHDIDLILEETLAETWIAHTTILPVISTVTGNLILAGNFRSMLKAALEDILLQPIYWEEFIKGIVYHTRSNGNSMISVHSIGTSTDVELGMALRQMGCSLLASTGYHSNIPPHIRRHVANPGYTVSTNAKPLPEMPQGTPRRSKIAIVGMSGRFPDAEDPTAFWKLLSRGLDVHRVVPPTRWDTKTHVDLTGKRKNTSATPYGCWLENPGLFDAKFFNLSPREVPEVDPAQRIALITAYEAIEQAGMVPDSTPSTQKDRVGVFFGVTSNDWMETNSAQNIDSYFIPGGNRAFIPGRINYFFKFSGPSYSLDTACSSSLAAIHMACNSLWQKDVCTAIAGGTNILTNPDFTAGLDRGHFLSRTGNCKSFDDSADGYCRGEGVGTVILKRLEDAILDKDPIQGLILGVYTNHSAEADSITRPHVGAQKAICSKILTDVNKDPYDISYVEMHGTGTQVGDAGEMESVLETFAPVGLQKTRREDQMLHLGSAKANIGHGEAASGVTSLVKVLLMMQNDTIPPHCGIKSKINHKFPKDLRERNVFIADKPIPWKRPKDGTRSVFINNFSAAGGNSAVLLEDAPQKDVKNEIDPRTFHIITASAKCAWSLKRNVESLVTFINAASRDQTSLSALSYTTTARRMHHPHRLAVCGQNLGEVKLKLREAVDRGEGMQRSKSAANVIFAFTGQGSQYNKMGKELFDNFSSFRSDINIFDQLARSQGYPSIMSVFGDFPGDIEDCTPLVVQLATVCLEMALARLWASWGIVPRSVIGHSLGEYAALNVAGVLSDSDTIYLVGKRAQLLQNMCSRGTHSMLAVKAPLAVIERSLHRKEYEIACINGPEHVVLSGRKDDILAVQKILGTHQLKSSLLKVPYAFHSSQVDPILEDFELAARGVTFRKPSIPVLCPLKSTVVTQAGVFRPAYLFRHCRESVNTSGALLAAKESAIINDRTVVMEIGPQPTVSEMITATLGSQMKRLPSLQKNQDTWALLTAALSTLYALGADIKWREYHRDFAASHKVLKLPAYNWDLKNYWMQYVNDWSLRKGDAIMAADTEITNRTVVPKLESTTIHKVLEEAVSEQKLKIVVESDISRPDLNPLVQGHKVNGIPLCTPSVYAEIALAVGTYVIDRYMPKMHERSIDIGDMVIEKALIAQSHGSQFLRASLDFDFLKKSATCRFSSFSDKSQYHAQHSHCTIHFRSLSEELGNLQLKFDEAKSCVASLSRRVQEGKAYKFNTSMIYKMVGSLAQFDPNCRALRDIVLDSASMEASGLVEFANFKYEGLFFTHPAFIDALSQIGGFVMNANDSTDLEKEVFINHGWKSFQLFEKLSTTKIYQTHVQMSEEPGNKWAGDITVLDGERAVAIFGGIVLQGVDKRALHFILSRESGDRSEPRLKQRSNVVLTAPNVHNQSKQSEPSKVPLQKPSASRTSPTEAEAYPTENSKIVVPATIMKADAEKSIMPEITRSALQIISEESGIAINDLTDNSAFAEMGVDSLLTLLISGRFKEELHLDIDSSAFGNLATVKDLKDFLKPSKSSATIVTETEILLEDLDEEPLQRSLPEVKAPPPGLVPTANVINAPKPTSREGEIEDADFVQALQIISEESGVAITDLTEESSFSELGIDSLLSLIIVSRFQEELLQGIRPDASIFTDFPTVKDLRFQLTGREHSREESTSSDSSNDDPLTPGVFETPGTDSRLEYNTTPPSDVQADPDWANGSEVKQTLTPAQPATSVILQGRPRSDTKTLILFPDGGGSASSYANLPRVDLKLAIIALNCPYVRNPEDMTCTFEQLMDSYITEIRRRQPLGPYSLGGWSSGGILAYRAAQRLIQEGDEVENLVLIDSPVPQGLDRLPQMWYDRCAALDIFGTTMVRGIEKSTVRVAPPKTLFAHFKANIEVLHDYHADPLPEGLTPKTLIVWASECVFDGVTFPRLPSGRDDTEGMKFLTEKRTDFSAGGWAELFPGENIKVEVLEGANHFSMMKAEHAERLAILLARAME